MRDLNRERIRVIGIGIAAALIAALVRAAMFRLIGTSIPFLTFFPAVIAASILGGTRAGTACSIFSIALAPFWMAKGTWQLTRLDWINLSLFALTCALIVWTVRQTYWMKRRSAVLGTQLAASEARFRHLADNIPQLAWMARPDGYIYWYNHRWFDYTGTTLQQMEGWGWQSVHDPRFTPEVLESWKTALRTLEPWEHTFPLRRHDGVFRWFLSRARPLCDETGKVTVWFGSNTDITEQRDHDEERRRLLESERAARSNAERASLLKDEFLATLSHELRTPLNAILGWTQLLRDGRSDESSISEGLEIIERNARAQTRIIEDLLEMSRIVSGKTRLDVQPVDLALVVENAILALQPAATAKGVRVIKVLDPVQTISGDPARLQQVMWNLLSNAIKFTPKGGQVNVALQRVESHLEITVSDNGEGISPEFLPFVFDRFRQQDASQKRRHGGLGLGLSIVKTLVELHGGTIRVESDGLNLGATFIVILPLAPLRHRDFRSVAGSNGRTGSDVGVELDGVRVLIIDDERDSLEWVRRLLQECKAEVAVAPSANDGLNLIAAEPPDVIVSDIGMPDKDGFEMIRELRARSPEAAKIPAIALTAFARSEDRTRAMLAGYQVHLAKPVEPQELIAAVANLAGRTGIPAS